MNYLRIVPIAILVSAACGSDAKPQAADAAPDCTQDSRAQQLVPGMQISAPDGIGVVLLTADPQTPVRFDNTWTLQAVDAQGVPLASSTLEIEPYMPDHGHGTPDPPEPIAGTDPGSYEMGPFDLWMPGIWELHFAIEHEAVTSMATLTLCIEE